MKNIILSLILSPVLLSCDSAFRNGGEKSGPSDSEKGRLDTKVCFSDELFCLPRLDIQKIKDPKADYAYLDNDRGPQYRKPSFLMDLRNQDLNQKISDNFQAIEYVSFSKGPFAILSRTMVNAMQSVRSELNKPLIINSGYRSPGYNKTITGAATFSRHTFGDAVDFKSNDTSFVELQDLCEKHGASFTLIYSSHIHCDWRQSKLDHAFFKPVSGFKEKRIPYHEITKGRIGYKIINNQLVIKVEDFFTEEPGDFIYEWTLITPSGHEIKSFRPTVVLNPKSGTYNISVQVGNSVELNETIQW